MAGTDEWARTLLVETVCREIAEASALQTARADAYLDGALRAAEQVQDVRIGLLEEPKEVSGWDFWFEIGVVFLLESNIVGALLKAVGKTVFVPLIRSNAVWSRIPKSQTGRELAGLVRAVSRGRPTVISGDRWLSAQSVLDEGLLDVPGVLSKDAMRLYHDSIQGVARALEPVDVANGIAKAANQARSSGPPVTPGALASGDTAGVQVIAGVQDYARITRLGIRVREARCIAFARTTASVDDLAVLSSAFRPDNLAVAGAPVSLGSVARESSIAAEALIWARLYGFALQGSRGTGYVNRAGPGTPPLGVSDTEPLKGIPSRLFDYWWSRLGPTVEAWRQEKQMTGTTGGRLDRAIFLRAYLAAVSAQFDEQVGPARGGDGLRGQSPLGALQPAGARLSP